MRLAILSDIHGNLEAFQAVCADILQQRLEGIICLGDMIGYGPDPEDVIRGVRNLQCRTVLGNHEAALLSAKSRNWMNFQARENSIQTEQLLSAESLDYCRALPAFLDIGTNWFVHGYPPGSVFAYLSKKPDRVIEELLAAAGAPLYFVGHTHELLLVSQQQGKISRSPLAQGRLHLEKNNRYIINAGSVGQPRDGNNQAKYVIWDDEAWDLDVRFIPYDIEKTIAKIHERGFPGIYAERLRCQ